jgi:hypothetical protein
MSTAVFESAEISKRIEAAMPAKRLSGFGWIAITYSWIADAYDAEMKNAELKQGAEIFRETAALYRKLCFLRRTQVKKGKKSTHLSIQDITQIKRSAEKLEEHLEALNITEPWPDFEGETRVEYLLHFSRTAVDAIIIQCSAAISLKPVEMFEDFERLVSSSRLAVAYLSLVSESTNFRREIFLEVNRSKLHHLLSEQMKVIEEPQFGGRVGKPVPPNQVTKLVHIIKENKYESVIVLPDYISSWKVPFAFLFFSLLACFANVFHAGLFSKWLALGVILGIAIGGALYLNHASRMLSLRKRIVFWVASSLILIEGGYLAFMGLTRLFVH